MLDDPCFQYARGLEAGRRDPGIAGPPITDPCTRRDAPPTVET